MPTSPSDPARRAGRADPAAPSGPAVVPAPAGQAVPAGPDPVDLAVVGAGPAGLAAAVSAAGLGLRVAVLDAGDRPGGQYYRHPAPGLGAARPEALHHGWAEFAAREAALREHVAAGRITHLPLHHVWTVVPGEAAEAPRGPAASGPAGAAGPATLWTLHAVVGHAPDERAAAVTARAVLIATGSYERQLPFPGWTLPGVVGAGGAQAMLKGGLVLPGKRVVVAGSGPLLLAVAGSLAAAGATVPAVVEAAAYTAYAGRVPVLLRNPGKLVEAAVHGGALARHHVRLLTRHAVTEAHGTGRIEAVTVARLDRDWRPLPGTARRIPCDALAVGHGLVPQLELATGLGCATRPGPDGTVALVLDAEQRTSVPGIWSAGRPAVSAAPNWPWSRASWPHTPSPRRCAREGRRPLAPTAGPAGTSAASPAAAPGCAPSPTRWAPPTVRARAGPAGCGTTLSCAAARRSRPAGSARRPTTSGRGTPVRSSSSPGPAWAGARAVCADRPSPPSPGRSPWRTAAPSPARSRCATSPNFPPPTADQGVPALVAAPHPLVKCHTPH